MAAFSKFSKKKSDAPRRRQGVVSDAVRRDDQEELKQLSNTTFRRNRTLTGSLSSQVSSAGESPQSDLQSPRTHAHHLARQRRRLSGVLAVVAVVGLALAGLLYEFTANPVVAASDGAVSLQKSRYEKVVDDYLSRHPVERLRFVLDKERLNDFVTHELPEVVSVNPEGSAGFGASSFSVTLRKPLVSWLIGSTQYYVDASGVPFQLNYYDIPIVKIVDQSGVQQSAGTAIASSRFLNFVGRAVSEAQSYEMNVDQAIIPANTTRQIELKLKDHAYPVKLSLDRSVGEQVEDMKRAVSYMDANNIKPQYVDVRVSGRAFYR
jgi:hypothetical protein